MINHISYNSFLHVQHEQEVHSAFAIQVIFQYLLACGFKIFTSYQDLYLT